MTNDDHDNVDDSFIIDEFASEVSAMLTRRSRDVPTNQRPLPSLTRTGGQVISIGHPTRNRTSSRQVSLVAAAAVLVLIAGALFTFQQMRAESGAVSVIADDPATLLPPDDATINEPTLVDPSDTPPTWTAQEAWDRFDANSGGNAAITTSLDPVIQSASELALRELPSGLDGLAVTIDASTGKIVGAARTSEADGWFDPHPIGSSLHLYTLVAAMEAGFVPFDVVDGTGPCDFNAGGENRLVTIENFGGTFGSVDTIEEQLMRSSRCGFAALENEIGTDQISAVVSRLTSPVANSITTEDGAFYEADDLRLSVIEQAAALATLVNQGVYIEPTIVQTATNTARGSQIFIEPPFTGQRFNAELSGAALDLLHETTVRGTATRSQRLVTDGAAADATDQPIAGITGSDPEFGRAWFVGVRGQLVTAVMLLSSDGGTMTNIGGLSGVTGGSFPTEAWATIHGVLATHRLATADTSALWTQADVPRDPIFIGTAAEALTGDELNPAPPPPSGLSTACPDGYAMQDSATGGPPTCYRVTTCRATTTTPTIDGCPPTTGSGE